MMTSIWRFKKTHLLKAASSFLLNQGAHHSDNLIVHIRSENYNVLTASLKLKSSITVRNTGRLSRNILAKALAASSMQFIFTDSLKASGFSKYAAIAQKNIAAIIHLSLIHI